MYYGSYRKSKLSELSLTVRFEKTKFDALYFEKPFKIFFNAVGYPLLIFF